MKQNRVKMNKNDKAVLKPAYEKLTFEILELKTQGVLCSSYDSLAGLMQQAYKSGGTL